jgi:hypothetical protein
LIVQRASGNLLQIRGKLAQGMGLETTYQWAVGLASLAVHQSAAEELNNLARSFLHAGRGFACLAHRPATLNHVV